MATKKKRTSKKSAEAPVRSGSISVTLQRARNGYVVSTYSDRLQKQISYIAKNRKRRVMWINY